MQRTSLNTVLATIGALAFAQAILGQFVVQGVPLFLRDAGLPSQQIGLVYLAGIPFTLPFLWAPLIDRYGSVQFGKFGGWILGSQLAACAMMALLVPLQPAQNLVLTVALLFLLMVAVGTQKTAGGGFMIEALHASEFAKGASVQAGSAAAAGLVLGAGVIYVLGDIGWVPVVLAILTVSAAMFFALIPVFRHQRNGWRPGGGRRFWTQLSIFTRSDTRRLFALSLLVNAAIIVPYSMKALLLIDAGFSVSQGGLIGILFANAAGIVGAFAIRPLIERFGAMRMKALTGLLIASVMAACGLLSANAVEPSVAVFMVIFSSAVVFAGFTTSRALLMPRCRGESKATELASFASLEAVCILLIAGLSAALLDTLGITPLLLTGSAISAIGAYWAWCSIAEFDIPPEPLEADP